MRNVIPEGEIRVAVLGALRGKSFAKNAEACGMKLVAVCDNFKPRLESVCAELGVRGYTNFNEFIRQDFDAVVIASPFHTHGHFARLALEAGKHVLSETSCNVTPAEGVELYRLAKKSGLCYMLAENSCYTRFNQEFKKLYEAGEIGEIRYAEGEYNHPVSISDALQGAPGIKHWRNLLPGCYYNTHALGPLMYITDTIPVAVSCSIIDHPEDADEFEKFKRTGYVMLVRMDNGAIFRLYAGVAGHSCWYGLHGTCGAMEAGKGHGYFGPETVRIWHEPWELKAGQVEEMVYYPGWPDHGKEADLAGHGGADFFVELNFAKALRTGELPYLDAYHGIMMTNVGIYAWKSAHQNGAWIEIPDLKDEKAQEEMLKDHDCPFPDVDDSVLMSADMRYEREFTPRIRDMARQEWKKLGYTDAEIEALLDQ